MGHKLTYNQRWYRKHRKQILSQKSKEYWANPEKIRVKYRQWYQNHKDSYKEYSHRTRDHRNRRIRLKYQNDPIYRAKMIEIARLYRKNNRVHVQKLNKIYMLKKKYNLTYKDYKKLLRQSNNTCKICGGVHKLKIDHCHKTSKIRGILCQKCNFGLGNFKDDVKLLQKASKYLQKNEERRKL